MAEIVSCGQSRLSPVRIVVTCTQRKTRSVPARLKLRTITALRTSTRLKSWAQRLSEPTVDATSALELYAGEHWDIARRMASTKYSKAPSRELWVCSAGYGLIPVEAAIVPYSATFSVGTPDSIPDGPEGAARWWAALADWRGPVRAPRSLEELVASDPTARLVLVLSAAYLSACRDDIMQAVAGLEDPKLLSIISAGTKGDKELQQFLLPVDARLQYALGGSRQALNVRAADHLLAAGHCDHHDMSEALSRLLSRQPPLRRYNRHRATDEEVRAFIREALRTNGWATHTRLLREFRSSQRACEQARFASLFHLERRSQQ
jgi:hypothetical protein